jgi:hypothetical protein
MAIPQKNAVATADTALRRIDSTSRAHKAKGNPNAAALPQAIWSNMAKMIETVSKSRFI